jgi:membrane fusion protein, copper/silver efflux system
MNKNFFLIATLVCAAIAVSSIQASFATVSDQIAHKKPLYWIDPMEPEVRYDKPGKSRMGMELQPVYEEHKWEDKTQENGKADKSSKEEDKPKDEVEDKAQ